MAYENNNLSLHEMQLSIMYERDPMLSMLKWWYKQLVDAEVAAKINTKKFERTIERKGYLSEYRVRRFDSRVGTMYQFVESFIKEGIFPSLSLRSHGRKRR